MPLRFGYILAREVEGREKETDIVFWLQLLDIVHPAARILTDIARSQDAEVGDGTTSVVVLAGEILKELKEHVEQGVSSQTIIKGLRRASAMAVNKIMEIAVTTREPNRRDTLRRLAATAMNSKLIHRNADFFTKMVVDAVLSLDQEDLNENLIGIKKITGGALQDSLFVNGVAFKKTFSYAGFEQQPKSFKDPKIVCLNVELELKSEKDNAEVRVDQVSEYQAIVDAEWQIIYDKMEALYATGAKVVLSKLPIGDLATQYFADRDVFCAGRVSSSDLERVIQATGGSISSTCSDIRPEHLGTCARFEERQIGGERFNFFEGCPKAKTCTLVLRGGAEQFIAEVERSLHDAIMIVKRAIKNRSIVAGGGACEVSLVYNHIDIEIHNISTLIPPEPVSDTRYRMLTVFIDGNILLPPPVGGPVHPTQAASSRKILRQSPRNHPPTTVRQRRLRRDQHPHSITGGAPAGQRGRGLDGRRLRPRGCTRQHEGLCVGTQRGESQRHPGRHRSLLSGPECGRDDQERRVRETTGPATGITTGSSTARDEGKGEGDAEEVTD